ncbi:heavy-metal-associated domain-containing protein [Corynebacterium sp. CCM 9185]|uniref:Heavy-metal-associated domain-containing protein n=1 Tax=Corynebacterium marambiense TaxID=2765364 RepID=A0ABS0VX03_9CORY|nr:heavy-metal-associated domain-containing protein [Corynebacterium marambiense]MBI8999877.1 heavy-metal-associated domain-containing protein [Corynebacterium marambiense]MCK7662715.1 heavy-metal-associated domain-containing protein [Corynebacterium marambiense]MCX7543726.1 heavy-metal-associated domain-containing protein [Corynebacterium marambiense]
MTKNYRVEGMTCEHCSNAVVKEVSAVPGTQGVDVDLDKGVVTVTGHGFTDEAISAAIEEAGYKVVD